MIRTHVADPTTPSDQIGVEPVDGISVVTVCDNTIDIFLLDEGPAHRILRRGGDPPIVEAHTIRDRALIDPRTPSTASLRS